MKKVLSVILAFNLLLMTVLTMTSCGKKSDSDVINIWIGGSVIGENETEEPQDTWIMQELIDEYSESFNVPIKLTYFEDEEAMIQLVANNGRVGNEIPDIACVFSSENLREMIDVLYPLTDYVTDEEKEHIMFWDTVTDNGKSIDEGGKVYGYPIGGTEVTFMAYNKTFFNSIGLDVENNPPEDINDLEDICKKLKNNNILPIVASDGGWNELYLKLFAKEWVQNNELSSIISEAKGVSNFVDDTFLKSSLYTEFVFYSQGYINKDYATNEDASTIFANQKAAMFCCSNFDIVLFEDILGANFGVFEIPSFSKNTDQNNICFGGCNQCLSVLKDSSHIEEAVSLIKWLSTKENNIRITQKFGCFPNRNDILINEYDNNPSYITKKIYPLLEKVQCQVDCLMPMEVCTEFYRKSLSVAIGEMTPEQFALEMDEVTHK